MIRFYVYAVIFNLGILIFVHELGHYLAARAAGVTVERFSIGFGPRILRFTRGATEYALSVIPFGGYVKMAGMEPPDASSGETLGPDTFLGKKIAVRAVIVASGPVTNFIWAVLVTAGVLLVWIFSVSRPIARLLHPKPRRALTAILAVLFCAVPIFYNLVYTRGVLPPSIRNRFVYTESLALDRAGIYETPEYARELRKIVAYIKPRVLEI